MSSTTPRSLTPLSRNGRALSSRGAGSPLAMLAEPHSAAAEAYRSLAANLQFWSTDRQLQTIGITSAAAGEGKSTTVANLAFSGARWRLRGRLDRRQRPALAEAVTRARESAPAPVAVAA